MQLPTQAQFVTDCLSKYRWESIPADQKWEEAHFPLPKCSGEDDTVQLWSADHTVQGLLQSVELDHKCFNHRANERDLYNLETYYPRYLELFAQLKSQFSSRQGKKIVELKLGIHGRSAEQMTADGKKIAELGIGIHAPGMASKAGKIGGKKCAELRVGAHAPGVQSAAGKIGGKKAGAIASAQRWQCLVTDYISTPCGLSNYQKARGIDTKLRVKIN